MKTEKNILIAFILNLCFSIIELVGGIFTNSMAIMSDAIHDFGDALSIGLSFILEKKSKLKPDNKYTYGYARFSILGALITTTILTIGSSIVIVGAIERLINPVSIKYDGMIVIAIFGIVINLLAAYFTKKGDSLNQKTVNLHMLEDVLGWIVVFIGSIIIKFTNITMIDSIMSIIVAIFILINALKYFKEILDLFLIKMPKGLDVENIIKRLSNIKEIEEVHHIHLWSIDGVSNYATMHVIINNGNIKDIKNKIKDELKHLNISHVTIEIEELDENCSEKNCEMKIENKHHH